MPSNARTGRLPWSLYRTAITLVLVSACSTTDWHDLEGKTALYVAAERGDLGEVRRLVEAGADVNSWNDYPESTPFPLKLFPGSRFRAGLRPLHAAVKNKRVDAIKYLLLNGADVDARDNNGQTPLALAASAHGDPEVAELLVAAGAAADTVDNDGFSPLVLAAREGHPELMRLLVPKEVEIDRKTPEGRTALHYASENGDAEIAAFLLSHGADPEVQPQDGQTALQVAVVAGHTSVVQKLLEKGADPERHAPGTSPLLIHAAYSGNVEIARLLLEFGAPVDEVSEDWTALQHAIDNNQAEVIPALILCGADLERPNSETSLTPLQQAVWDQRADAVRALLEGGADPNRYEPPLSPPLARAARDGTVDIVTLLLLHGADVHTEDQGWTPLRLAEFGNHPDVAELLRQNGATR